MLSVKEVSKSFNQRGIVLDKLSLTVGSNELVAIMGPSGSGKTTLMNIIGLLDKPDSGSILFNGTSVSEYSDQESAIYRNSNIGFVFQEHLLLPYLTVYENIFLPCLAAKQTKTWLAEKENFISELMSRTGIASIRDKYPASISGGEAQRAALVRALVNKPSLLLADEPTGSLDLRNADNLGQLLLEVNRDFGIAVLVATHSQTLADRMSKVLRLVEGHLI